MANSGLIRDVVNQGISLEFANAEVARKNIADARNKLKKDIIKNPEILQNGKLLGILDGYLEEVDQKIVSQFGIEKALNQGIKDGKTFVADAARIGENSSFYGWTPSVPLGAISLIESEFSNSIKKTTSALKEKILRTVQTGIASGADIGDIQTAILGTGLRGLKGRDGVFRSATARAETIARTVSNDAINRGAMITYNEVDQICPELGTRKLWQTVSDRRTSDRCESLRGQIKGLKENFISKDGWQGANPPSHPNCRSRVTCITERYKSEWDNRWTPGNKGITTKPVVPVLGSSLPKIAKEGLRNALSDDEVFSLEKKFNAEGWNNLFSKLKEEDPELGERLENILEFQKKKKIKLAAHNGNDEKMYKKGIHFVEDMDLSYSENTRKIFFKNMMKIGDDLGLTAENTNIVVVATKANRAPNLISAQKYKESLQDVYAAKAIQLDKYDNLGDDVRRFAKYDLKFSVYNPIDETDGSNDMVATYIHEMGHQVHYKAMAKMPDVDLNDAPFSARELISSYGADMERETFAEGFLWYTLDPDTMKDISPNYFNWIDEMWRLANG